MKKLNIYKYSLNDWSRFLPQFKIRSNPETKTAAQIISTYEFIKISDLTWIETIDPKVQKCVETELKYKPFTGKMLRQIEEMKKNQEFTDISNLPYEKYEDQFTGEEYEKLIQHKPKTIYAASRISGIRPTTLIYLHFLASKRRKKEEEIAA